VQHGCTCQEGQARGDGVAAGQGPAQRTHHHLGSGLCVVTAERNPTQNQKKAKTQTNVVCISLGWCKPVRGHCATITTRGDLNFAAQSSVAWVPFPTGSHGPRYTQRPQPNSTVVPRRRQHPRQPWVPSHTIHVPRVGASSNCLLFPNAGRGRVRDAPSPGGRPPGGTLPKHSDGVVCATRRDAAITPGPVHAIPGGLIQR
jgi:hypothetical protein